MSYPSKTKLYILNYIIIALYLNVLLISSDALNYTKEEIPAIYQTPRALLKTPLSCAIKSDSSNGQSNIKIISYYKNGLFMYVATNSSKQFDIYLGYYIYESLEEPAQFKADHKYPKHKIELHYNLGGNNLDTVHLINRNTKMKFLYVKSKNNYYPFHRSSQLLNEYLEYVDSDKLNPFYYTSPSKVCNDYEIIFKTYYRSEIRKLSQNVIKYFYTKPYLLGNTKDLMYIKINQQVDFYKPLYLKIAQEDYDYLVQYFSATNHFIIKLLNDIQPQSYYENILEKFISVPENKGITWMRNFFFAQEMEWYLQPASEYFYTQKYHTQLLVDDNFFKKNLLSSGISKLNKEILGIMRLEDNSLVLVFRYLYMNSKIKVHLYKDRQSIYMIENESCNYVNTCQFTYKNDLKQDYETIVENGQNIIYIKSHEFHSELVKNFHFYMEYYKRNLEKTDENKSEKTSLKVGEDYVSTKLKLLKFYTNLMKLFNFEKRDKSETDYTCGIWIPQLTGLQYDFNKSSAFINKLDLTSKYEITIE